MKSGSFGIQHPKIETADSVLLSLFMRDNGRSNIPHAAYLRAERYSVLKKVVNLTVPKDQKR